MDNNGEELQWHYITFYKLRVVVTCISVPPFAGCRAAPAPATSAAPALLEMAWAACNAACADADCKNITYK